MRPSTKEISILPLKKAALSLEKALSQTKNEFTRDATIQRFEYTFELAWKTLKRYIESNTKISEFNLKNLFREAGKQGLITSVEKWFHYLVIRNQTSHTYDERVAEETYLVAQAFLVDLNKLIYSLEMKLD